MTRRRNHAIMMLLATATILIGCKQLFHQPTMGERIEGLKSNHPAHVRRESVQWIMEHPRKVPKDRRKEVMELLCLLLAGDQDRLVRGYAAVALGRFHDPDGISALLQAAGRDRDALVRCDAIKSLAKYDDSSLIPELAKVAQRDREAHVRQTAVIAIADLGGKEAVPALIDLLADRDPSVAFTASERLCALTGQPLGQNQEAWRQWWRESSEKPAKAGAPEKKDKAKKDVKAEAKPAADVKAAPETGTEKKDEPANKEEGQEPPKKKKKFLFF
ncbi:MAG: HEAT repeat domain-containing protein [Planctomycetota bacterium]